MATHTLNTDYEIVACPPIDPKQFFVRNRHNKKIVRWKAGQQESNYFNASQLMANIGKPRKFDSAVEAQGYINAKS